MAGTPSPGTSVRRPLTARLGLSVARSTSGGNGPIGRRPAGNKYGPHEQIAVRPRAMDRVVEGIGRALEALALGVLRQTR